jgi:hypothetical protein
VTETPLAVKAQVNGQGKTKMEEASGKILYEIQFAA